MFTISSLTFDSVALGGSDWSGTQTGDATGSLIHGHRFTMQQSRVATLTMVLIGRDNPWSHQAP